MDMSSPHILLMLLPLWVFVLVIGLTSPHGMRSVSRWLSFVLRGGVATALLVIWAGPEEAISVPQPRRLEVVFDVSASILSQDRRSGADAIQAHVEEWYAESADDDRVVLVAFAGQAELLLSGAVSLDELRATIDGLRSDNLSASLSPESSDLALALRVASAGRWKDEVVQRLVFTDGACRTERRDSLSESPATLLLPSGQDGHDNFRVTSLQHASWLRQGDALAVSIEYTATRDYPGLPCVLTLGKQELASQKMEVRKGLHTLTIQQELPDSALGQLDLHVAFETADVERLDDGFSSLLNVSPARSVLLVRDAAAESDSMIESVLSSQGALGRVCSHKELAAMELRDYDLVVLDKVPSQALSSVQVAALSVGVRNGMGLCVIPSPERGRLKAITDTPMGEILPLRGLMPPPIAEKKDDPEDEGAPRLTDQNPEDSEVKEVDAPTLTLLLVIDKSTSMRESARLSLAKAGAIATARALHPDDSIGVVVYNDLANDVVPIQPARNLSSIERSINSIRAGGATSIRRALQFARSALNRDDSAVKVVILLSDGHTPPFDPKPLLEAMVREGITVHTVGVGSGFDVGMLTQIANFGGGKGPIPARTSKEIPQVMVDVATDVMTDHKTRRADDVSKRNSKPEIPRVDHELPSDLAAPARTDDASTDDSDHSRRILATARPVSYVAGIEWATAPPPSQIHAAEVRDGAWLSLETVEGKPVLAHQRVGRGLVSAWAFDPELDGGAEWAAWSECAPFLARHLEFMRRVPAPLHMVVAVRASAEGLLLEGTLTDRRDSQATGPWSCTVTAESPKFVAERQSHDGVFFVPLPDETEGPLTVVMSVDGQSRTTRVHLPPDDEILNRELDFDRLKRWCASLGEGTLLQATGSDKLPRIQVPSVSHRRGLPLKGLEFLIGFLLFEIALRRWEKSRQGRLTDA